MSKTNDTTRDILGFLRLAGIFAWRQNVLPIPVSRKGVLVGYRSGGKSGLPDIVGIAGVGVFSDQGQPGGRFIGVEVKTGRDKLRDEQIGFHTQARKLGAVILVVSSYEDFLNQWLQITTQI